MKRLTLLFAAILLSAGIVFTTTVHKGYDHGAKATAGAPKDVEVVGYVSDSMCGLKHMAGMGDEKSCALACVKGGSKFVLADRDQQQRPRCVQFHRSDATR